MFGLFVLLIAQLPGEGMMDPDARGLAKPPFSIIVREVSIGPTFGGASGLAL